MIYAYRDGKDASVPVVMTYGGVGPSFFHVEDWGIFGQGRNTDESRKAGAALFTFMSGQMITPEEIQNQSYLQKVKAIAAAEWIKNNPILTVAAYGAHDRVQPFAASKRLEKALNENHVDYKYYVFEHSGHGLQNDNAMSKKWMVSIEEYLNKYIPIEK